MNTYLFDFDGTLVDSMPTYGSCMLRILDDCGISYESDLLKIITPLGCIGTANYYREVLGVTLSQNEILELMYKYMFEEYAYNIPAKENVVSVLQQLKAQGASLNVLTASPHITLDPCLKRLGLWELFDNVWSCNDFNTTKSDPEIYRMAADRIGQPIEEIIFLDDNYNADLAAKQTGMIVYGVYDDTSREYVEDIKSITDRYIFDFAELLS